MPRVERKRKIRLGAERSCGECGKKIEPGEEYLTWKFRYGGARFRCTAHPPRQSDLTLSKLATVYSALEDLEDAAPGWKAPEHMEEALTQAADQIREVAEEYQEASEPFGYQGENYERYEELDGFASEVESVQPPYHDEFESLEEWREAVQSEIGGLECPL